MFLSGIYSLRLKDAAVLQEVVDRFRLTAFGAVGSF
jgi:hypothetical protein